jgi:dipeptidyl aminopeptidase/acylaminoacyl peptidase
MKAIRFLFFPALFISQIIFAQDGKIISQQPWTLPDSVYQRIRFIDSALLTKLKEVNFYRITYLSDGLKVTGFIAEPKAAGTYPCIISNRGGNRDFGQWDPFFTAFFLGRMASWNYVVIASQYRGNDGGEGKEEFGGKDVDDVLNLIPALTQLPKADTTRIGMEGTSRGGMMAYMALRRTCKFKAAVVVSGVADAFKNIASRPEMETYVFAELVPDYKKNKEKELRARSAVYWADEMCKTTPLLILQGSGDKRVEPSSSVDLVQKLLEYKHPVRYVLYEGADHGIREFAAERFAETKAHFDKYLRDGQKLPNLEPHGL